MAFDISGLVATNTLSEGRVYKYTTTDSMSTVHASGYFQTTQLRKNDWLGIIASDGNCLCLITQDTFPNTTIALVQVLDTISAFTSTSDFSWGS